MLPLKKIKSCGNLDVIHFIGIGGIGMSGIAEVMHNLGYKVQGSDLAENNNTKRLQDNGLTIFHNHNFENINNASYIVISSAIKYDNPEVKAALEKKIPIIKRAEMLAELMRFKYSVAISGAHGKTTTTSLVACLFEAAGLNPTVINGGIINNKLTNAYVGTGDYLIAEADESDATFVNIPSTVGVITNISAEHMDFYKDFDLLVQTYKKFITKLPFYGFGVACIDHPIVRLLVDSITERKIITYGIDSLDANVRAFNISCDISSSTFDVSINLPSILGAISIEKITIPVPGKHNVLNSLAAIAIGAELDFGIKVIKNGFQNFNGVKRRFTKIVEYNGASIIDDYAHHPVEIEATLATARLIANQQNGRVIAIFQPHRYSRMSYLFNEFSLCFKDADKLYITDIYAAGEENIENLSALALVNNMKNSKYHNDVEFMDDHRKILALIRTVAMPGDIIIMMGAGNISVWANNLPMQLAKG